MKKIVSCIMMMVLLIGLSAWSPAPNQVAATLVKTTDGDTAQFKINGKITTVRYLLVDTPEEKKPGTCLQPFALDAQKRNDQLLRSGKITLEYESKNKVDKYGRTLAYVFVNGKSVQETLLQEGYARVAYVYYPPYKYLSQYQKDETIAKNRHLRIWSKSGYATAKGFIGCVSTAVTKAPTKAPVSSKPTSSTVKPEYFANCTELRKKYPHGVPKSHPAYRVQLDRDKDGYACEQ